MTSNRNCCSSVSVEPEILFDRKHLWLNPRLVLSWILSGLLCTISQSAPSTTGSTFPRTIYLIRHGAYAPDVGPDITPLGIAQARLVASRLAGLPSRFDSITSSTMPRAIETAAVMQEILHVNRSYQSAHFSECTPPTATGTEIIAEEEKSACAKVLDAVFAERFVPATRGRAVELIVTHGNVIRYLVVKALGVDTRVWNKLDVAHASITTIRIEHDGSISVWGVGEVGHIPPALQSWSSDHDASLELLEVAK